MARCKHGFLPPAPDAPNGVRCPKGCHGEKPRNVRKAPARPHVNFVDLLGSTIAGVAVLERAPNQDGLAVWRCRCACGAIFEMGGKRLRKFEKAGSTASCEPCARGARHANLRNHAPTLPSPEPVAQSAGELRWWRLELDADGKVRSCTAVEHCGAEGEIQFIYVQARDQKEAGRAAWNAYCKIAVQRRRAKLTAEGKCPWCARESDRPPGKRCTPCLDKENKARADRKLGIVKSRDQIVSGWKRDRLQEQRVAVLREVWSVMNELNGGDFRTWLETEAQIDERKAASG